MRIENSLHSLSGPSTADHCKSVQFIKFLSFKKKTSGKCQGWTCKQCPAYRGVDFVCVLGAGDSLDLAFDDVMAQSSLYEMPPPPPPPLITNNGFINPLSNSF